MIEKFNIAGYCRISVDIESDKNKNISIEHQKELIKEYVEKNFPGSTLDFFEDRDKSGYTFEQRPGYQMMRPNLINGTYDILIVKDFSRFSRRNGRGLVELEELRDAGLRIISIGDIIDFPNDDDWFKIQFHFLVNEMPVTDTSKKVNKVVELRQEKGEWICAAPYGYKMAVPRKNPYEIIPEEAEVVQMIYDLYLKGWGYKKIANYLTDKHILTPRASEKARKDAEGEKNKIKAKAEWSIATVQGILTNDAYIGTLRQGKTKRVKINGKSAYKHKSEHIVIENHHEPIIDFKTFAAAQEAMKARTRNNYRGVKKYDNFYSGLMVCGDCGSPMFPMSRSDLKEAYRCGNYHNHGVKACSSHHIRVDMLDSVLKGYLVFIRNNSAQMIEKINESLKNEGVEVKNEGSSIENLQRLIEEAKEERKIYLRQKTRDIMRNPEKEDETEKMYDEMIDECSDRIIGLENQIAMISHKRNTVIRVNRIAKTALEIFDNIINKDKLDRNDLALIIEKITVYKDHVEIELKSDIDALLKCGTLPETETAANFNSGTVDTASTEIVQVSRNHSDKVYSVNVISNGDPLEIYTDSDGEVIFKKYSPIGELSSITGQYAEVLSRGTGLPVIVTDRDCVIACAGISKKEALDRRVSRSLENLMERRETFVCCVDSERIKPIEGLDYEAAVACPIVGGGDVSGSIILLMHENGSCPTQTETKLTQIAASFLGKQMEE